MLNIVLTNCLVNVLFFPMIEQTEVNYHKIKILPSNPNFFIGCLDNKKNVMVLTDILKPTYLDDISKVVRNLNDNPCYRVYIYALNIKKFVPWNGINLDHLILAEGDTPVFINELTFHEIIGAIQDQYSNTNQTLLFFFDFRTDRPLIKELKTLDAQPNWNVIFVCEPVVCKSEWVPKPPFPINRMVPSSFLKPNLLPIRNHLKSLIDNPEFDRFELIKKIKIGDQRLKCLKNATIRLQGDSLLTLRMMEDVVLLLQNTQHLNTHVRFYFERPI